MRTYVVVLGLLLSMGHAACTAPKPVAMGVLQVGTFAPAETHTFPENATIPRRNQPPLYFMPLRPKQMEWVCDATLAELRSTPYDGPSRVVPIATLPKVDSTPSQNGDATAIGDRQLAAVTAGSSLWNFFTIGEQTSVHSLPLYGTCKRVMAATQPAKNNTLWAVMLGFNWRDYTDSTTAVRIINADSDDSFFMTNPGKITEDLGVFKIDLSQSVPAAHLAGWGKHFGNHAQMNVDAVMADDGVIHIIGSEVIVRNDNQMRVHYLRFDTRTGRWLTDKILEKESRFVSTSQVFPAEMERWNCSGAATDTACFGS